MGSYWIIREGFSEEVALEQMTRGRGCAESWEIIITSDPSVDRLSVSQCSKECSKACIYLFNPHYTLRSEHYIITPPLQMVKLRHRVE